MSDKYYTDGDNLPDTPQTLMENHEAQIRSLDGLVQQTADELTQVEQNLGWLYGQAEQRGDEDAKLAVNNAWQIAQNFANRVVQYDAVRISAAAVMAKLNDDHRRLAKEHEDLLDDLATGNEDNPLLAGFAEGIQEQAWNDMSDMAAEEAYDDAHEAVFYDLMMEFTQRLREITGSDDFGAINRVANCVLGDEEPTEEQKKRFRHLLDSFEQIEMDSAS